MAAGFRCKQFFVSHQHCAMKVGTDGLLLGAFAPLPEPGGAILDIGAGSGLISLMLAQRSLAANAIDHDGQCRRGLRGRRSMPGVSITAFKMAN